MTRAISDNDIEKEVSRIDWRTAALERRVVESEAGSITCLRALRDYGTGLVVGTAVETPITFDEWENEDSAIFGEELFSGALQKVKFKAQGVYTVTITIAWETQFDGVTEVAWLDDSNTAGNWPFGQSPNMGQFGSGRTIDSFNYPLTLSITKKFPRLGTTVGNVTGGVYGQIFAKVFQRSGTNKDLSWAAMDIFYHGPTLTEI